MSYALVRKAIALNVKKQRELCGYNQRELALRAKVSQKTISNLENLESTVTSCNLDVLFSVADALGIGVFDLLGSEVETDKTESGLLKEALELAKLWQSLPPDKQKIILETIKAFANDSNPAP